MALQEEFQHPNGLLKLSKISYQDFTFKLHEDYFVVGLSEKAELHHWHYRNLAIITSHLSFMAICVHPSPIFCRRNSRSWNLEERTGDFPPDFFFRPGFVFEVWYFWCWMVTSVFFIPKEKGDYVGGGYKFDSSKATPLSMLILNRNWKKLKTNFHLSCESCDKHPK